MKFLIIFTFLTILSSSILASQASMVTCAPPAKGQLNTKFTIYKYLSLMSSNIEKKTIKPILRNGCCSHHNGVCGCQGSRQLCCDGRVSPSCLCGE